MAEEPEQATFVFAPGQFDNLKDEKPAFDFDNPETVKNLQFRLDDDDLETTVDQSGDVKDVEGDGEGGDADDERGSDEEAGQTEETAAHDADDDADGDGDDNIGDVSFSFKNSFAFSGNDGFNFSSEQPEDADPSEGTEAGEKFTWSNFVTAPKTDSDALFKFGQDVGVGGIGTADFSSTFQAPSSSPLIPPSSPSLEPFTSFTVQQKLASMYDISELPVVLWLFNHVLGLGHEPPPHSHSGLVDNNPKFIAIREQMRQASQQVKYETEHPEVHLKEVGDVDERSLSEVENKFVEMEANESILKGMQMSQGLSIQKFPELFPDATTPQFDNSRDETEIETEDALKDILAKLENQEECLQTLDLKLNEVTLKHREMSGNLNFLVTKSKSEPEKKQEQKPEETPEKKPEKKLEEKSQKLGVTVELTLENGLSVHLSPIILFLLSIACAVLMYSLMS